MFIGKISVVSNNLKRNLYGQAMIKNSYVPNFYGEKQPKKTNTYEENTIIDKDLKRKGELGNLSNISFFLRKYINQEAYKKGVSNDDYLKSVMRLSTYVPNVSTVPSRTAKIGRTNVTTLMDGEQIFNKTLNYIKSADKSIQVEMFEFQNLCVDGGHWSLSGAKNVPGAKEQQQLLGALIKKKQENPDIKIQVILDAHKWYIDSYGKNRHYANADMIKYLKTNGIDVVPYPRAAQQGTNLQHVKMVVVDGKKVILGGMNWGTHSAANHDSCIAIETQPNLKNSEVDNIIENQFNTDWKFAWQRLGNSKFISGPLSEDEQKFYYGLDKEIKEENVQYSKLLSEIYGTDEMKNRYKNNDLDLIKTHPIKNSQIAILGTKPKEVSYVGAEGEESTRKAILNKMQTCKKVRGELFVLTDKELVQTIIKREKNAQEEALEKGINPKEIFDAEFIVDPAIIEEFPYCENAFAELKENGVNIRTYNANDTINQRLHSKWAVFDDKDIIIGSTNWSAAGLDQNLKTGLRPDYELNSMAINKEINKYLNDVASHEESLNIPPMEWNNDKASYIKLLNRRKNCLKALTELNKNGETVLKLGNCEYYLKNDEDRAAQSELQTVYGYYGIIKARYNAQEKYKRGNNEAAVMFASPSLAKYVYEKQFNLDWNYSNSNYDNAKDKEFGIGEFWNEDDDKKWV